MNQPSNNKHFSQRSQSSGYGGGGSSHRPNSPERAAAQLQRKVFDSAGPDGKVRGTAQQVYEKYLAQARDAHGNGDRVLSENCLQHAEHYLRILNSLNPRTRPQHADEEIIITEEDDRFADLRGGQSATRVEALDGADTQPSQQHMSRLPRHETRDYTPPQRAQSAETQSAPHVAPSAPAQHRFAPRAQRSVSTGNTPYVAPAPLPAAFVPQQSLLEPAPPVVPVSPIAPAQAGLPRGTRRGFNPAATTAAKPDNMVFEAPTTMTTSPAVASDDGAPPKRRLARRRSKGTSEY